MTKDRWIRHAPAADAQQAERLRKELRHIGTLLALGLGYVLWFRIMGFGLPCLFHVVTTLDCPGCGMSRAAAAASHFHFREAMEYNMLSLTLLPLLAVLLGVREVRYIRTGERTSADKRVMFCENALLLIMLIWALAYAVWRNLPVLTEWFAAAQAQLSR